MSVIKDLNYFAGSRSTFRILATDSIFDAVDEFGQRYRLPKETRAALVDYLEVAEEAAETFPTKIEVALSEL